MKTLCYVLLGLSLFCAFAMLVQNKPFSAGVGVIAAFIFYLVIQDIKATGDGQ